MLTIICFSLLNTFRLKITGSKNRIAETCRWQILHSRTLTSRRQRPFIMAPLASPLSLGQNRCSNLRTEPSTLAVCLVIIVASGSRLHPEASANWRVGAHCSVRGLFREWKCIGGGAGWSECRKAQARVALAPCPRAASPRSAGPPPARRLRPCRHHATTPLHPLTKPAHLNSAIGK